MKQKIQLYNKVYDFTNENVACLKNIYHFENAEVLSIIGSGDQFFSSVLSGAKKVDLVDINPTSYLYFALKFYSMRELTYEEFYDFMINKNFNNIEIFNRLEKVLPKEVLKYYIYLIMNSKKKKQIKECFRHDGIDLFSKFNQKYYFNNSRTVIPYLYKVNYYKLQEKLKIMKLPKFYNCDFLDLKPNLNDNYDILLLSNIYNRIPLNINEYTKLLKQYDIPEIQACYDWHGWYIDIFSKYGYLVDFVAPSAPDEYAYDRNYIYTLKK